MNARVANKFELGFPSEWGTQTERMQMKRNEHTCLCWMRTNGAAISRFRIDKRWTCKLILSWNDISRFHNEFCFLRIKAILRTHNAMISFCASYMTVSSLVSPHYGSVQIYQIYSLKCGSVRSLADPPMKEAFFQVAWCIYPIAACSFKFRFSTIFSPFFFF